MTIRFGIYGLLKGLLVLQLMLLVGCVTTPPKMKIPPEEPSAHYLKKVHPRVVLVLGSGSARGFAHAGVIKALEDNHIPIDMIVGTSAGSIVGALYADNPSADKLKQLLLNTPRNEVIDFSLMDITQGAISGNSLQNFLVHNLKSELFEELPIPFVAVATDLHSGQIHVFGSGPIAPAVNASSAAPPFFRPVTLYGRTYIDGGVLDPVAVDVAESYHPKLIIAVSLDHPLSKTMPSSSPGVFLRGFDMMLMRLNDYSASKAHVVIRPEPDDEITMFDSSKRDYLIQIGEKATQSAMEDIKRLLKQKKIALKKD